MAVKVTIDRRATGKLSEALHRAAELTIEALRTDVIAAQVMPFDNGTMQNTDTFTDTTVDGDAVTARLITGSPQARRLYFHPEYNYQTVNNPNAGGEWLAPWIDGERREFVQEAFDKILNKEAGA